MPRIQMIEVPSAALVVVDVQEKMLAAVTTSPADDIVRNVCRLVEGAKVLDVPILFTEQYPQGLGPTVAAVRDAMPAGAGPIVKSACSCWRDGGFRAALRRTNRRHVMLAGLETHVCVQQTALDLMRADYLPFVAADAAGSRRRSDMETAIERMRRAGAEVSTTEAILFELIERCDHPRFKDILRLVK